MAWIAGVDGCKGGWIAALRDVDSGKVECVKVKRLAELLDGPCRPTLVAIDIPIGLMDGQPADNGERRADVEARRLVKGRASSVFPAPIRPVLSAATYAEANALTRKLCGHSLTRQSFAITPRIAEVDREARTRPRGLLREVFPEACFWRLNGGTPMSHSKHTAGGIAERQALLELVHGNAMRRLESEGLPGVKRDDLYDALACLETARRIHLGVAERVPERPPVDSCGLPMEINF